MKPERICSHATIVMLMVFLLTGCVPFTENQEATVERTSFITEDDLRLSGTLYAPETGEIAVLLAHQGTTGTDQRSWQPFVESIARRGFAAPTFDFRGSGQSEGEIRANRLVRDVRAAIGFLRDRGFLRIVCVGASMGGTACLKAALETDLEGLVVIASTPSLGWPTQVKPEDYSLLTMRKLYICAQDDSVDGNPTGIASLVSLMYKVSPEPKELRLFPGKAHGTELFERESGDEFREMLVDFLEGLRQVKEVKSRPRVMERHTFTAPAVPSTRALFAIFCALRFQSLRAAFGIPLFTTPEDRSL